MEKYYFEMDAEFNCKEECNYFSIDNYGKSDTVNVGSMACKQCDHNISYCADENWIKCEVFSAFAEVESLKSKVIELSKIIDDQNKAIIEYKEYEETVIGMFENKE